MSARETLTEATKRIQADHEHGASYLAREAAKALFDATGEGDESPSERLRALSESIRSLAEARPSMAAVTNTVAAIWSAGYPDASTGERAPAEDTAADTEDETRERIARMHVAARKMLDRWADAARKILEHARPLLGANLFTFSRSGTVESVLTELAKEGSLRHLWVTRSFPGNEGLALADALVEAAPGLEITVISDAACGVYVGQARGVVVGADSVWGGSVVNKVGTYPLTLVAQAAGIPVYVLCESLKIGGDHMRQIEQMNPHEIVPNPKPGITARNPYFEVTPGDLITAIVTEEGVLSPQEVAVRMKAAEKALWRLPPKQSR